MADQVMEVAVTAVNWIPLLLTFVLGFLARAIPEWFQDRRLFRREQEARRASRRERLEDRRRNFQSENLLNLQESLYRLMRGAAAAHHHFLLAYKRTGEWGKQLLPRELDEMVRDAQARTSIFVVRIHDAGFREQVQHLKKLEVEATMAHTPSDSERAIQSMGELFVECNYRIGELLRGLDDELGFAKESKTAVGEIGAPIPK
jgi:hypothetical protein